MRFTATKPAKRAAVVAAGPIANFIVAIAIFTALLTGVPGLTQINGAAPASGPGSSITWAYVARETGGLLRFWFVNDRGTITT